jgi:hypothetical protein
MPGTRATVRGRVPLLCLHRQREVPPKALWLNPPPPRTNKPLLASGRPVKRATVGKNSSAPLTNNKWVSQESKGWRDEKASRGTLPVSKSPRGEKDVTVSTTAGGHLYANGTHCFDAGWETRADSLNGFSRRPQATSWTRWNETSWCWCPRLPVASNV